MSKLNIFLAFSLLVVVVVLVEISTFSSRQSLSSSLSLDTSLDDSAKFKREKFLVLIYTEFYYGGVPWKGLQDSNDFNQFNGEKCPATNCNLTYNKQADFLKSDVVIFHAYNIPPKNKISILKKMRPIGQIWVYFNLENPIVTSYIAPLKHRRDLDGVFNWTMTYSRESDIYFPYGFYLALDQDKKDKRQFKFPFGPQNHASGKDKLAVWTASGCGQVVPERKIRLNYIGNLREHMPIDIFGKCAEHFTQRHLKETSCARKFSADGLPTPECKALLQSYKFFLAFENMDCVDYITEKYWCTPLELGLVPVVMGGADYKALAIPGSYIDVMEFSSQKDLARYLLYLDKNDTAYNQYFEWKKRYQVGGCFRRQNMTRNYPWMCEICAAVNNQSSKIKSYDKMYEFWNPEKNCGIRYSRVREALLAEKKTLINKQ